MWYTATSANVTTGATVVAVTTGDDISIIQEDSGLIFEGESPVQVKRGYIDGFGDKFIELVSPWPYTDKVAQPIVAYPTDASFAEATAELRRVIDTLEVASTVDMQAATNDTKIATPLKVKQAIDFNTGTAATRDVGESAGNLMEVGAFGLGGLTPLTTEDLTGIEKTGFYWYGTGATNKPTTTDGHLINISRVSTVSVNLAIPKNQTELYIQNINSSNDWVKTYHTGNILGTVSQSGGVPTGAIIERGSNVNGEYVRYADGTMICTLKVTGQTSNSSGNIGIKSFPSSFIDLNYYMSFGKNFNTQGFDLLIYSPTTSNFTPHLRRGDGSSYALGTEISDCNVTIIGKWY